MTSSETSLVFRIHGMDCAEEVAVLKRELGPLVGGDEKLGFDVLNAKMTVAAGTAATPEAIQDAVARTGMRAEPWRDDKSALVGESFWERNRRTALTAASGGFLLAGLALHVGLVGFRAAFDDTSEVLPPTVAVVCYVLSILSGVWTVLPKAWIAAKRLAPDMNLLMVVAVGGAVAINCGRRRQPSPSCSPCP